MQKTLTIHYEERRLDELDARDVELIHSAQEALATAHNPYSHFYVGAALRLADGTIVLGSNQENIAYP